MFILRWHFFGFINQATAQTAEPIFTHNTSKEPVWAKEVPFGGQKFFQKFFDPKKRSYGLALNSVFEKLALADNFLK